jgi:hypothetical protein
MHRKALTPVATFLEKWSFRIMAVAIAVAILATIALDVALFGTISHHDVWPSFPEIMWSLVMTMIVLVVLCIISTHRARRFIVGVLGSDAVSDALMLGSHIETKYDGWTLMQDCLWLVALFLLLAGSPPKEESKSPAYPSIERIP